MHKRRLIPLLVAAAMSAALAVGPAGARPRGTNGQITFDQFDQFGNQSVFTANPDGSHVTLLVSGTCCGGWSPGGGKLAVPYGTADGRIGPAIVNADGTGYTQFPIEDPTLNVGCGTGAWSPDGELLA